MTGDKNSPDPGTYAQHLCGMGSASLDAGLDVGRRARPILFSAPMVRALLDGRKTQTRRVVKFVQSAQACNCEHPRWKSAVPHDWHCGTCGAGVRGAKANFRGLACPYGVPGDVLYVRETWQAEARWDHIKPTEIDRGAPVYYVAGPLPEPGCAGQTRVSIHMPRWASRISLRITDVRVERLNEISEADAIAEGIYRVDPDADDLANGCTPEDFVFMAPGTRQGWGMTKEERAREQWSPTAPHAYKLLWEHINGPGSWDANPWVWAVSFEPVPASRSARTHAAPSGEVSPGNSSNTTDDVRSPSLTPDNTRSASE